MASAEESWVVVAEPEPSVVVEEVLLVAAAPPTDMASEPDQACETVVVEAMVVEPGFQEPLEAIPAPASLVDEAPLVELPPTLLLPPGFTQHVDPSTGMTFYCNTATGATQWEFPIAPPPPLVEEEVQVPATIYHPPLQPPLTSVSPSLSHFLPSQNKTDTHLHHLPSLHELAQAAHHLEEVVVQDAKEIVHTIEEAFHHIRDSHHASTQTDLVAHEGIYSRTR